MCGAISGNSLGPHRALVQRDFNQCESPKKARLQSFAACARLITTLVAALSLPFANVVSGQSSQPNLKRRSVGDFLFDNANGSVDEFLECCDDPLHIGMDKTLGSAKAILSIDHLQIKLQGCRKGDFAVTQDGPTTATTYYTVYYPIIAGRSEQDYLAPITHEFGHVRQLSVAGSPADLLSKFIIKRIELEADFLTGVAFSRLNSQANLNQFQQNLTLVGMYFDKEGNEHGKPEERTKAFRRGYNYDAQPDAARGASIDAIRKKFQDDIYGEVLD